MKIIPDYRHAILHRKVRTGIGVKLYLIALMFIERFRILRYDWSLALRKPGETPPPPGKPKIHLVYFSCGRDFDMLCDSIRSLLALRAPCVGRVYLVIDRGNGFSRAQLRQLHQLLDGNLACLRSKYRMLRGPGGVIAELLAFRRILPDMGEHDALTKMDSDTLFLSAAMFNHVLGSRNHLLGEENKRAVKKNPCSHVQGGCYFLKRPLMVKICQTPLMATFKAVCDRLNGRPIAVLPEDLIIHELAASVTDRIEYIDRASSLVHLEGRSNPNAVKNSANARGDASI